jgi:VanZ family protein
MQDKPGRCDGLMELGKYRRIVYRSLRYWNAQIMINGGLFSTFPSWLVRLGIIATLITLAAISVASLSPVGSAGDPGSLYKTMSADKIMHVFAYALAILPLATVPSRPRLGIALGALIWSGAIELLQTLVGRSASFSDLMANAAGVFLGFSMTVLLRRDLIKAPR